jgi:hypothetical protein
MLSLLAWFYDLNCLQRKHGYPSIYLTDWLDKCFNFMDGINGITILYALTAIISFALLPLHQDSLPLITMGMSCVVLSI